MRKLHINRGAAEIRKLDEQWRQGLTPLQYRVLRQAHIERPFTGEYVHNHQDGFYRCACSSGECSARTPSPIRARGGPASPSPPSPRRSNCGRTTACSCAAPRSCAVAGRSPGPRLQRRAYRDPGTGTTSTPARWLSSPRRRARGDGPAAQPGAARAEPRGRPAEGWCTRDYGDPSPEPTGDMMGMPGRSTTTGGRSRICRTTSREISARAPGVGPTVTRGTARTADAASV